jgi:hypothetical protein
VTVSVTGAEPFSPSLTVSEKTSVSALVGAVNVALPPAAAASETDVPLTCVHIYVSGSWSGSELAPPSNITSAPAAEVVVAGAAATGARS